MLRSGLCCTAFVSLLFLSRVACASTTIAGGSLDGAQTWTAAASPYFVQGDVTVPSGASLIIEPGTEVQFATGDALASGTDTNRVEFIIKGSLLAHGTARSPITFHAQAGPGANAWYGIVIDAEATSASLQYVDIEDANNGVTSAAPGGVLELSSSTLHNNVAGVWLNAGQPVLTDLLLSNNTAYGIFVLANAADAGFSLTNSVAKFNGSYGVYVISALGHAATASILNSTIHGNVSAGVTSKASGLGSRAQVTLCNSIVSSNGILGIDSSASDEAVVSFNATYSDVWSNGMDYSGSGPGDGCFSLDPGYLNAPDDLRLQATSPCVDHGTGSGAPVFDLLGRGRPQGAGVDVGAYEYVPSDDFSAGEAGDSAGGAAGAAGTAGAARTGPTRAGSGCSCSSAGSSDPHALPWLALSALALFGRRVRRR